MITKLVQKVFPATAATSLRPAGSRTSCVGQAGSWTAASHRGFGCTALTTSTCLSRERVLNPIDNSEEYKRQYPEFDIQSILQQGVNWQASAESAMHGR